MPSPPSVDSTVDGLLRPIFDLLDDSIGFVGVIDVDVSKRSDDLEYDRFGSTGAPDAITADLSPPTDVQVLPFHAGPPTSIGPRPTIISTSDPTFPTGVRS